MAAAQDQLPSGSGSSPLNAISAIGLCAIIASSVRRNVRSAPSSSRLSNIPRLAVTLTALEPQTNGSSSKTLNSNSICQDLRFFGAIDQQSHGEL